MNISSKRKIQLTVLFFLMGLTSLIIFALMPLFKEVSKASDNLSWQKAILGTIDDQIADVESFQNNYKHYQKDIKKVDDSFINYEAPIKFIGFLEDRAKEVSLDIQIIPVSALQKEGETYKTIDFQVIVAGPFLKCIRFLDRLEQSPWLFETASLYVEKIQARSRWLKVFENTEIGEIAMTLEITSLANDKYGE